MSDFLSIHRGTAPLIVAFPHGGTELGGIEPRFGSPWLARRDADWWIEDLYAFVREMGATTVSTVVSRSVIDVNRDPSGASLYPGMATTELCPTTTFDGERLYRAFDPEEDEIDWRRRMFFDPYHAALADILLRTGHHAQSHQAYSRAIDLAGTPAEQAFLASRRAALHIQ